MKNLIIRRNPENNEISQKFLNKKNQNSILISQGLFFCDIISKGNFNILTLLDLRRTYISKILIFNTSITFEILSKFLDKSFDELYLAKPKLLILPNYNYSQVDGSIDDRQQEVLLNGNNKIYNINSALKEVCHKHKLQVIKTRSDYGKQISECINKVLWGIVSELCIQGLENISFPELIHEHQFQIIHVAFNLINTSSNTKDNKLLINKNKLLLNKKVTNEYFAYEVYNYSYQIMAKSDNKKSRFVILANSKIIKKYKLEFSKTIYKVLENLQKNFVEPPLKHTIMNTILDYQITQTPPDLLMSDSNSETLIKILDIKTNQEIIEFLNNYVKKNKIDLYSTPNFVLDLLFFLQHLLDYKVKIDTGLISLETELSILNDEIDRDLERTKDLHNQVEEFVTLAKLKPNQSLEIAEKKDKDLKLPKYKIKKNHQYKFRSAIFSNDFNLILDSVKSTHRFVLCRDKIAHLVLKYTGLRVSDLKYVTIRQLQNLFRYEKLTIKNKNLKILNIPVVKSAKDIIELARPYWQELNQILKRKGLNFDEDYNQENVKELELWGDNNKLRKVLSLQYLNRRINDQLYVPGAKLKKNLTSQSYREGVAITIGKILGIAAAKKFLNSTNISTKVYLKSKISNKELISIYNAAHKFSTVKDFFNIKNFGNISDKEIQLKINKIISKEKS